jgi:hypothetical protein
MNNPNKPIDPNKPTILPEEITVKNTKPMVG